MYVGIDIGSVSTKAVIIDENSSIMAFSIISTKRDRLKSGEEALGLALKKAEIARPFVKYTVSTGYGRSAYLPADDAIPEIICQAKGTQFLFPKTRTVIDIGGQDSKVMELDENGSVFRFEMNDKCAAGTGRFLEVLTERILEIPLDDLGRISLKAKNPCILTSVCTIFAESEIISLLSENMHKEDIAYGMHRAIAKRVINMGNAGQISWNDPIVFTGGVAKNIGVVRAIEELLKKQLTVPDEPQITGAFGAALFARQKQGQNA